MAYSQCEPLASSRRLAGCSTGSVASGTQMAVVLGRSVSPYKSCGATPTMVAATPFSVIALPTTSARAWKRSVHAR